MTLTDKRFWIFEAFTVLYAVVLMLLELIIVGKSLTSEIALFIIGWSCITGAVAWPFANGKHWFAFGLIYEATLILLLFACLVTDGLIRGSFNGDDLIMCVAFVFPIVVLSFLPSIALAFVDYNLFKKSVDGE